MSTAKRVPWWRRKLTRRQWMVVGPLFVVLVIILAVSSASGGGKKATNTSSTTTATTAPMGSQASTGTFSYQVSPGHVALDSATKAYSVPVLVKNTGGQAAVPWCVAIVESSPGSDIGIGSPERFSAIGPGSSATVRVTVKATLPGMATQVEAICASSASAASHSFGWSKGHLAAVRAGSTTSTTVPAQVVAACNAVRNLAEDVNIWTANHKAPASFLPDTRAFVKYVLVPGGNATLISEAGTVTNDFKAAEKTGNLSAIHNALVKMATTCLSLSP